MACGCICPECRKPLIAKQGDIMMSHYAHVSDANCQYGESYIHYVAKHIIATHRPIKLPNGTLFEYTDAYIEAIIGKRRVDILLYNKLTQESLVVEIAASNELVGDKIEELTNAGYRVLEINIQHLYDTIEIAELTPILLDDIDDKYIFEPAYIVQKKDWNPIPGIIIAFAALVLLIYLFSKKRKFKMH